MEKFKEKEMYFFSEEKTQGTFGEFLTKIPVDFDGYVFQELYKDPIGRSEGNPTWGELYSYEGHEMYYKGTCVYKEIDYEHPEGAYAEKLWSLIGRRMLTECKVPKITLVKDKRFNEIGMCSHNIIDKSIEEPCDIKNILFNKYERQEIEKLKSIVPFDALLECVRIQIKDDKNFKKVEKDIVNTLLLDSFTNNSDRHANNWTLVRDKRTNEYKVGLFDHSSSFIDMISSRYGATINGWTSSYISMDERDISKGTGSMGDRMIKALVDKYPEYSKEFFEKFSRELPGFYDEISIYGSKIDAAKVKKNISEKKKYMQKLLYEKYDGAYDGVKEGREYDD